MGQGTRHGRDDEKTRKDIPRGDGLVGDEQIDTISGRKRKKKTGQDHSTENYGETEPTGGVGGAQDNSDTMSDIARIRD